MVWFLAIFGGAIADRLSFRRFVGLSLHDRTPDHSTLWRFRQELAQDGLIEQVFAEINRQLEAKQLVLKQGTLIDASLVTARAKPPRKARGQGEDAPEKPSADPDARWGKKGKKSVFGYKNLAREKLDKFLAVHSIRERGIVIVE